MIHLYKYLALVFPTRFFRRFFLFHLFIYLFFRRFGILYLSLTWPINKYSSMQACWAFPIPTHIPMLIRDCRICGRWSKGASDYWSPNESRELLPSPSCYIISPLKACSVDIASPQWRELESICQLDASVIRGKSQLWVSNLAFVPKWKSCLSFFVIKPRGCLARLWLCTDKTASSFSMA